MEEEEEIDRISDLPEPILHHILKLIPFNQVAQTCVLSKRWEQVWRTYPNFIIDDYTIDNAVLNSCSSSQFRNRAKKRIRVFDCVEQALRNRNNQSITLESLNIDTVLCRRREAGYVNRIIGYAIGSNVKRLTFNFEDSAANYYVPETVFSGSSIEVLELQHCHVRLCRTIVVSKLPSLIKLNMSEVDIDDHGLKTVLAGCPLLEELYVSSCPGLKTVDLFGHEKLKKIDIDGWDLEKVDVNLVNLASLFVFHLAQGGTFDIGMTNCANLRRLELVGAVVKRNRLSCIISELLLLECLELRDCQVGEKLIVSNASLEGIEIRNCEGLIELVIDSPNLRRFTYYGDIINICHDASALSRINLSFWPYRKMEKYIKLVELLGQFHGCSGELTLSSLYFKEDEVQYE